MAVTLPESLIESIKVLVKANNEFKKQIEELQMLSNGLQSHIDRLVASTKQTIDDTNPHDNKPMQLPRAIIPDKRAETPIFREHEGEPPEAA